MYVWLQAYIFIVYFYLTKLFKYDMEPVSHGLPILTNP